MCSPEQQAAIINLKAATDAPSQQAMQTPPAPTAVSYEQQQPVPVQK